MSATPYKDLLFEQMEEGRLDPMSIAKNLALWFSEDDIKEFCEFYEITPDEEPEEE